MKRKWIPVLALILLTSGCVVFGASDVPERKKFWEEAIVRINTAESNVEELLVEYSDFGVLNPDEDGLLQIFEDDVKDTGFPCSHWRIGFAAKLDGKGSVSDAELKMTGHCL